MLLNDKLRRHATRTGNGRMVLEFWKDEGIHFWIQIRYSIDQPLFAIAKKIQWTWPHLYGEDLKRRNDGRSTHTQEK